MSFTGPGAGAPDYAPCRYGASKLSFRGPAARLDQPYWAMLGGTMTYGKFVEHAYPALVARATGHAVVNLGIPNAGVDAYLGDPEVLAIAAGAEAVVLQIPGAQNLSNRYYRVHPRRNDRFLTARPLLRMLFREVDFTEFNFTRHMLTELRRVSPLRFERVADELRAAWLERMQALIEVLAVPVTLLWAGENPPPVGGVDMAADPLLVTRAMVDALRPAAAAYVEVIISAEARAQGTEGMLFSALDLPAARLLPGPAAHAEVAAHLAALLAR
ncbi:DUF6473 family protein [Gemmobacter sp. LW-1]|uniref:DUF6473 family protein n=1 Tax=Gemmobacter sp. LW-1 TaxID=1529005 RepID=UPI0006C75493|nr:DUF6473 family protein [Gemmobacter sp. LW-1]